MAASFFRGTALDQNVKFKDKDLELTKKWQFPPEFDQHVNLSKVSARAPISQVFKGLIRRGQGVGQAPHH